MSYILEALRKSEEARQRKASVATPILPHSAAPAAARKPMVQSILLPILALIIGCCLLAAGYLFFFQPQQKAVPRDITSTTLDNEPGPSSRSFTNKAGEADTSIPELYPANKKTAISPHTSTANDTILQPAPLATAVQQDTSAASVKQAAPTIPLLEELAPSFQESIPDLQLAGHAFSAAPHLRMIVINNAIVRENDVVAQNLVLEEITRNGIILRSGDTRFRLDVQ